MYDPYLKKILNVVVLVALIVLSFLVLKPILMSIILGLILAFIFTPLYKLVFKLTKSPTFSATLMSLLLISIVLLPIWFFTPIIIDQSFKFYMSASQTNFVDIFKGIFPSFFASEQFSAQIGSIFNSFITKIANYFLNGISNFILNFPSILMHLVVVLFTFFFSLRDRESFLNYIKNSSPFSKDVETRLFRYSKDITASVLYGQVILGIIQGVIVGISFFLFGIPNALLLSLLATLTGILPIVGPMIIWIPVFIYLLVQGNNLTAIGILLFGLIGSNIDNILRPLLVSKKSKIHSSIVLIGMIGGLFMFGILGLILGPLILSYLITISEAYRKEKTKKIP